MIATRPAKSVYSETEAAEALGISVEHLRTLIRTRILRSDEEIPSGPAPTFQPSDLLILRLLSTAEATPTSQH